MKNVPVRNSLFCLKKILKFFLLNEKNGLNIEVEYKKKIQNNFHEKC